MGPKLDEQIGPHIQAERGAKALRAGAESGDPVGHPGTRHLSGCERACDTPGGQRVARAIVAPHPESSDHGVFHARPKAALTDAMIVQIFVRPTADGQLDGGFNGALAECTSCTFGESIDAAAPLVRRVTDFIKQRTERGLGEGRLPDQLLPKLAKVVVRRRRERLRLGDTV